MIEVNNSLSKKRADGLYLTAEADTLDTVCDRGNSTDKPIINTQVSDGINWLLNAHNDNDYGLAHVFVTGVAKEIQIRDGNTIPFVASVQNNNVLVTSIISTVAIGTSPYACTSTTLNTNLNADLLDGQEGSYYLAWANFTGTPTTLSGYGISDTMANFDTTLSDGNFAYAGGAFHDGFSDFVTNEHIDWTSTTSSLSTTGNGTFNRIALGGSAIDGDRTINLLHEPINDNADHAAVIVSNPNSTITGTYNNYALWFLSTPAISSGVTDSGLKVGIIGQVLGSATHAGTLASMYGSLMQYGHTTGTTGTTNNVYGLSLVPYRRAGTIDNLYSLFFSAPSGSQAGTVTTKYDMKTNTGWNWWFASDNQKIRMGAVEGDFDLYSDGANAVLESINGHVVLSSFKTTTGDPTGVEGKIYWNTFDNAIKMYADGAWRTLASW